MLSRNRLLREDPGSCGQGVPSGGADKGRAMAPRIGPEPPDPGLSFGQKFLHALPFGIGIRDKPRYYLDYLKSMWDNKKDPMYARAILRRGVCDGCSLGPAGLR